MAKVWKEQGVRSTLTLRRDGKKEKGGKKGGLYARRRMRQQSPLSSRDARETRRVIIGVNDPAHVLSPKRKKNPLHQIFG